MELGFSSQCCPVAINSVGKSSLQRMDIAQAFVRLGVCRVERYGATVTLRRPFQVRPLLVNDAEVVEEFRRVSIQLHGRFHVLERGVNPARLKGHHAQEVQSSGLPWIGGQNLAIQLLGARQVACLMALKRLIENLCDRRHFFRV